MTEDGKTIAEDATEAGDNRGQFDVYIRGEKDADPTPAMVVSSAYTLAEYGVRTVQVLVKNFVNGLWKFS